MLPCSMNLVWRQMHSVFVMVYCPKYTYTFIGFWFDYKILGTVLRYWNVHISAWLIPAAKFTVLQLSDCVCIMC